MGGVVIICLVGGVGGVIGGLYKSISNIYNAEGFWNKAGQGVLGLITGSLIGTIVTILIFLGLVFLQVGIEKLIDLVKAKFKKPPREEVNLQRKQEENQIINN